MTSRRQPSGKGKERREPLADREDDLDDGYDLEEQIRRPKDSRILCFIPNDGIDYSVIRAEVPSFLGVEASVSRGKHPTNERPGYYIRAYRTLSITMMSDLKMDTIRWNDEMRVSNNRDYKASNTHRMRLKSGPTPEPPVSPPATAAPSQHRQDKGEEPRSILFDVASPTSEMLYEDANPGRVDRAQQPQSQRGYDEQMRPSGQYTRPDGQVPTPQSQDSRSSAYQQSSTNIYIQNVQQARSPAPTVATSAAQPTYTRQDVERKVMQRLREQGHKEITRPQLDKAVDQAMRTLQQEASAREERSTSVPPPYTEQPGGPGQPRPSQPSTSGTRGFESKYATSGPDYRRHMS